MSVYLGETVKAGHHKSICLHSHWSHLNVAHWAFQSSRLKHFPGLHFLGCSQQHLCDSLSFWLSAGRLSTVYSSASQGAASFFSLQSAVDLGASRHCAYKLTQAFTVRSQVSDGSAGVLQGHGLLAAAGTGR